MATSDYRLAVLLSCELSVDRLTDSAAHEHAVARYERVVAAAGDENGGSIVKRVGETHLLTFSNAQAAVNCALAIAERCASPDSTEQKGGMLVRIGVHVGEVHFFENDAIGEVVAVTARLQSLARAGAVCVSEDVYRLVSGKLEAAFSKIGSVHADNTDDAPVAAYEAVIAGGGTGGTGAGDNGDEREIRQQAFAEIKRAGRRLSVEELRDRLDGEPRLIDRVLAQMAEKGFLTEARSGSPESESRVSAQVERGRMHIPDRRGSGDEKEDKDAEKQWDALLSAELDDEESPTVVEEYVEQTEEAADKAAAGFRGHLATYVGVNALLFVIYVTTSGAGFPWFLIPLSAWGIGVASHAATVVQKRRESRLLRSFSRLNRKVLRIFRKLTKTRNAFSSHLVSTAATSAFLAILNLLVSPGFFWAIFPIGGMGIGVLSHLPAFKSKERRLTEQLRQAADAVAGPSRASSGRTAEVSQSAAEPGAEAQRLRGQIIEQLGRFDSRSAPFGEEIEPVLDDYVSQVTQLSEKHHEIAGIINSIPVTELENDLQELSKKRREAGSERVAAEYDRSIEQVLKQKRSYEELTNEQEMLSLRLRSGLNTLKQMHIDLARMHSLSAGNSPSTEMLRQKSTELSNYLRDLERGYAELG